MKRRDFFQLSVLLTACVCYVASYDIFAHVSNGDNQTTTFIGEASNEKGLKHAVFLGIRYGSAPVKDKRYQKSTFHNYGELEIEAKKHGPICPQEMNALILKTDKQREDCLFLNVYVPLDKLHEDPLDKNLSSHHIKKRAVYVFIHGGAFIHGGSNLYDIVRLTSQGDIIAVSLNYRLGVLGFLTTDDNVLPANLGLWDQQLAIRWVYENIEAFGGDRKRITVGGQSAGSISAILQSFHEGNDKLFQNVIAESGSPIAFRSVAKKGFPLALEAAKHAGCKNVREENTTSTELRDCLLKVSVGVLIRLKLPFNMMLLPVYDNDFISAETFQFMPQSLGTFAPPASIPAAFANKNLLAGFVSEDGEVVYKISLERIADNMNIKNVNHFKNTPIRRGMFKFMVEKVILQNMDNIAHGVISNAIIEHYTDWSKPLTSVAISQSFIRFAGDLFFHVPVLNTAYLHSTGCQQGDSPICNKESGKTYLYEFTLPPDISFSSLPWFKGSIHGMELLFLSDRDEVSKIVPNLEDYMIAAWSNFVKTGNPNTKSTPEWKQYTLKDQDMYRISENQTAITQKEFNRSVHFWNEYVPQLESDIRLALATKESAAPVNDVDTLKIDSAASFVQITKSAIVLCHLSLMIMSRWLLY